MNQTQLLLILAGVLAVVLPFGSLSATSELPAQVDALFEPDGDGDIQAIVKAAPVYPPEAVRAKIEGYVVVEFTVNERGVVEDPVVVAASPEGWFETAALNALSHFKYKPRVVDGNPVAASGIRNRLTFALPAQNVQPDDMAAAAARAVGNETLSGIEAAQLLVDAGDLDGARQRLEILAARSADMNDHELAQLHNMLGYLAFQNNDYWQAIMEYEQVVAQPDIPQGLRATTLFTLAQLNFVQEEYQVALRHIDAWLAVTEAPGPTPFVFIGQTQYRLNDYPAAIESLEKAVVVAKTADAEIKENWWALLSYLYFEEENWTKLISTLEVLQRDFPDEKYAQRLDDIRAMLADSAAS